MVRIAAPRRRLPVVGYQDFNDTVKLEKILVGATFQKIDNTKVTLGDIGINSKFSVQSDEITLLNTAGGILGQYVYVDEQLASEVRDCGWDGFSAGWYDSAVWGDWDWEQLPVPTCYNDTQLEIGEAVMIQPGTTGGGLVFNGQVAGDDIEVKGNKLEKSFRCNCTPSEITLGQIFPNSKFSVQSDELTLLNPAGGIRGQYVYVDEQLASEVRDCG